MMILCSHIDIREHLEVFQNLGTHNSMPFDQAEFQIRQPERLVEHGIRHTDLTHIMQHSYIIYILNLFIRPSQSLSHQFGVCRHTHGMPLRVIILGIHCIGNCHDRLNRDPFHLSCFLIQPALQILTISVKFQCTFDTAHHDLRFKRLGNKIAGTHAEAFHLRLGTAVCRKKNNRNLTPAWFGLQCLHNLKPANLRHIDIQQDQIRCMSGQIFICLLTGIHCNYLVHLS